LESKRIISAKQMFAYMPATVDENRCDGCGSCIEECPMGAIELDDKAYVDAEICTDCENCVEVCPNDAILLA
jgi:ferredoxin